MEKLLSIIIPVYNTEQYLHRCLYSILDQIEPWKDKTEVVLINDGSTDNSGVICNEYEKIENIRVIHKENAGLSDTRNVGINSAVGKYLLFLDSDDLLNTESLNEIFKVFADCPDADVYVGRYISVYDTHTAECPYQFEPDLCLLREEKLLYEILKRTQHYDWYAVLNIVKRDFIIQHNLFFEKGRCFEDALWTPNVLFYATKVRFFNYPFYKYVQNRKGAITRTFTLSIYNDKLNVCNFFEQFCKTHGFAVTTQKLVWGNLNLIYNSLLADFWKCPKLIRRDYWKQILRYNYILKFSSRKKDRFLYLFAFVVSFKVVSYLLHLRTEALRRTY